MREHTLVIIVRAPDEVPPEAVAQQMGDALNPDSWAWDVSFPLVHETRQVPSWNTMTVAGTRGTDVHGMDGEEARLEAEGLGYEVISVLDGVVIIAES